MPEKRLDDATAGRLLAVAVENVRREYPVHWVHVVSADGGLVPQRELHPVFAGSFDWHSCVHQTWQIVRLLRLWPTLAGAEDASDTLDSLITLDGSRTEAAFFDGPQGSYWERPYGWAWLLTLAAELHTWESPWAAELEPLTSTIRDRFRSWIAGARLPVRTGTHGNTAFAAGLVLDAARAVDDVDLAAACESAALRWYSGDRGYGGFEPDAPDFLSPILTEADLMRRVLPADDFVSWFEELLPDLGGDRWRVLRSPVEVEDASDPYGAHLVGLALSRAWQWRAIGEALPPDHRFRTPASDAAAAHADAGWRYVFDQGYATEHWVGSYALYLGVGAFKG
ncbi:DUF2891 domain-containing protein [Saccharothrix violaceirubra]|uniref:DUF2891 family protein n=1 Tax=Saccharothrix violaceirubra TaxID=413306 RepID=A0A7W7T9H9_9PSEU|nr:DUF2891 domain-containing protein [Saccharothrix violaceirubra]MBB4967710.1 hypothetical protein [Saccharothrix violaceirubra]